MQQGGGTPLPPPDPGLDLGRAEKNRGAYFLKCVFFHCISYSLGVGSIYGCFFFAFLEIFSVFWVSFLVIRSGGWS